MTRMKIIALTPLIVTAAAAAQTNIDAANKWSWSENAGWLNWHDAGNPPGNQGAAVHATFLSGFVWAENIGWINLGDGDPGAPGGFEASYSNTSGTDFGVNLDPASHQLSGFAWSENAGWINFSAGAAATPPNAARLDTASGACRLRGFVWAENLGWINLDLPAQFVGLAAGACPSLGDMNCDGAVNAADAPAFVLALLDPQAYAAAFPSCSITNGDMNADGLVDGADVQLFVARILGS